MTEAAQSTTQAKLIEAIVRALPYSGQIRNLDLSEAEAIRFDWRQQKFRIGKGGFCETREGKMLVGGDVSILLEALVKKALAEAA